MDFTTESFLEFRDNTENTDVQIPKEVALHSTQCIVETA